VTVVAVYRTRRLRRVLLRRHLVDAVIGVAVGVPLAVLAWLATLWVTVR
jgi:hypothetical protein